MTQTYFSPQLILFFFLLLYLALLLCPYIPHKKISSSNQLKIQDNSKHHNKIGTERIAYIDDNTKALLYRLRMIEEAEKEIILSTFDFNADQAGKDMMSALFHAANRGVSVKVIIDGISGFVDLKGSPWFQAFASHKNISIKIYNPIHLLKPWKFQARLHDKYLIIDHKMFLLGGRNTTNLFLGTYSSHKNIDRELFVYETEDTLNSSLYQLREYYEKIWNLLDSKPYIFKHPSKKLANIWDYFEEHYITLKSRYKNAYNSWDWNALTFETNEITLLTNPINTGNKEPWIWNSIYQYMNTGNQIIIYTPYIICGNEMYQDLSTLCHQNKQLEIITNDVASGANPWGCTDYLNQRKRILKTGVKVYEYMGAHSSHTKAVLIDDQVSIVGSYNLDMRSTYQDTELMLAVDSKQLNAFIRKESIYHKAHSKRRNPNGTYTYGENYSPKKLGILKTIFYIILRILTIPFRRFL